MRRVVVVLAMVLAACAGDGDPTLPAQSAPSAPSSTTTTAEPTTTTTVVAPVSAQPATPTCPAVPARPMPAAGRPRYRVDARLDLGANTLSGDLTVTFTPDLPTDRLVFRLWPNGPRPSGAGARLDVGPVSVDGKPPTPGHVPEPTTLDVALGRTVPAGQSVTASLPWSLRLPGPVSDRIARIGDTVRLGSFLPILSWEPGIGWAREPATSLFAEASVAPVADFDLGMTGPDGLTVLASGVQEAGRWKALAMRDVAVSVGRFRVAEAVTNGGVRVTVAVEAGLGDDQQAYLGTIVRAIDDFAGRFGPYPWPSYSMAVTPALRGGIEYPGHVLQGPGSGGRTTPHEVAHMWFYALVGNNQGRDPWMDEGLATWAEARFLGTLGETQGTAIPAAGRGRAGEPMTYWERRSDAYYRSVYVQGAQALAALGPADGVECALRHYVAAHAHRIARPRHLVDALRVVFPDAEAVLNRYGIRA